MRRTEIAWWQKMLVALMAIGYLSLLGLTLVVAIHFVVKYW